MGRPAGRQHALSGYPRSSGPPPARREEMLASFGYVGAIAGPVLPLLIYLAGRRGSPFVRWHAAQALDVALTFLLYLGCGAIIGGLLSFDTPKAALAVMIPVAALVWLITVLSLVRAAAAAAGGGSREIPAWICSPFVR